MRPFILFNICELKTPENELFEEEEPLDTTEPLVVMETLRRIIYELQELEQDGIVKENKLLQPSIKELEGIIEKYEGKGEFIISEISRIYYSIRKKIKIIDSDHYIANTTLGEILQETREEITATNGYDEKKEYENSEEIRNMAQTIIMGGEVFLGDQYPESVEMEILRRKKIKY